MQYIKGNLRNTSNGYNKFDISAFSTSRTCYLKIEKFCLPTDDRLEKHKPTFISDEKMLASSQGRLAVCLLNKRQ